MNMLPSHLRVNLRLLDHWNWRHCTPSNSRNHSLKTKHHIPKDWNHSLILLLAYALMQLCNPSSVTCYIMNEPHCWQILLSTAAISFIFCRVLVFHFFLHHVMLNFTNICKLNTLQPRVCITIITGLAVSIPCKLYVSILNFLHQAICLIEKEMSAVMLQAMVHVHKCALTQKIKITWSDICCYLRVTMWWYGVIILSAIYQLTFPICWFIMPR